MGGRDGRNDAARDASPRVPPQSEDFQETGQVIPPEQVRRIEADPAHGESAIVDPNNPRGGWSDAVPAEWDEPPETRSSQPPTTVVDWRVAAADRHRTPPDPRDRHAGPGHAGDEFEMLKDPATTYGGRHRPQASDLYRLSRSDAAMPRFDAARQRAAASPAARRGAAGARYLIAAVAFGLAALVSLRLWAVSRR